MLKSPAARALIISSALAGVAALAFDYYDDDRELAAPPLEIKPRTVTPPAPAPVPPLQPMPKTAAPSQQGERKLREIFAGGRFEEAKAHIENELRNGAADPEYKAWLRKQLVIVKTALAWTAVQKRDCAAAQQELSGLDMQEAPALAAKALGFCSMQDKDWISAEQYLELYVNRQAKDAEGFMLLSSVKEAQGSFDEAIDLNAKALSIDGSSARLAKKAESLTAQQEESLTQTELRSGMIRLRYQAPIHFDLAQNSLDLINETVQRLNIELGLEYPSSNIEIIFHRSEQFGRIAHGPAWASALYDGEIRVPIADDLQDVNAIAEVLRHEITHALLDEQSRKRPLPSWFQEGLAQIVECGTICWSFPFAATQHPFLPADVFNKSFLNMSSRDAQVAYKQSRYMMAILYQRKGAQGIRQIISRFAELSSLDSDSLLQAVDWTYQGLYEDAARNWAAQKSL